MSEQLRPTHWLLSPHEIGLMRTRSTQAIQLAKNAASSTEALRIWLTRQETRLKHFQQAVNDPVQIREVVFTIENYIIDLSAVRTALVGAEFAQLDTILQTLVKLANESFEMRLQIHHSQTPA